MKLKLIHKKFLKLYKHIQIKYNIKQEKATKNFLLIHKLLLFKLIYKI